MVHAGERGKLFYQIAVCSAKHVSIDLLKRDNIGVFSLDHLGNPQEIHLPIHPFAMMDVISHHPQNSRLGASSPHDEQQQGGRQMDQMLRCLLNPVHFCISSLELYSLREKRRTAADKKIAMPTPITAVEKRFWFGV